MNEDLQNAVLGLELLPPTKAPTMGLRPVISVLDDFSEQCFADVASLWPVQPNTLPIDLDCLQPEFLLVESAWNGNRGSWRYLVTSAGGTHPPLVNMVAEARRRGIPTVFWNKEDPPHFDDFAPAAILFDYIFTSEIALVERYQELAPHAHVDVLKFAASTTLHRPERVDGHRSGDVCFAGQYFRHKYPERRAQMDFLFSAAANFDFTIYSRMLGGLQNYAFPDQYLRFIAGSLPYSEMVKEYRRHKIFLNVNSVPESRSMCARRVFELASSKTIVLSAATPAIRSVYTEDEVPLASNADEAMSILRSLLEDDDARQAMAHRAWRRTAREHTYSDRMRQVRTALGIASDRPDETVGLITPPNLPHEAMDRLAADLLNQQALRGFRWTWLVDEPSWLAERSDTVRQLAMAGIDVTADADTAWWAAWHPGVARGAHFLEDMLLYASRYAQGRAVCADPGAEPGSRDASTSQVCSALWLAPRDILGAEVLRDAARRREVVVVKMSDAYLVSGVDAAAASLESRTTP